MKKAGIIGCGNIAQVHAWAIGNIRDVKLTALCDIDIKKAEKLAEKISSLNQTEKPAEKTGSLDQTEDPDTETDHSYVKICENWKDFLDSDLDVIHVCTPHFLHAPMASEMLKNGKAVFVEKPCAISSEQFEELKKADSKHPGKLGFCFQNRYNETTLLIEKLVSEGRIGKVQGGRAFVTWRRDDGYYTGSAWKGRLETEGGGALINQSIHTLDLLLGFLGEPIVVKSSIANHHLKDARIEVEDTVEAWMEFPDGKRACFYASNGYASDAPVILELQGEKGRICMNGSEVTVYRDGEAPEHYICEQTHGIGKDYWGCGHKACIEDFYRCLDNGETFRNNLAGVENSFMTMMRIYGEPHPPAAQRPAKLT